MRRTLGTELVMGLAAFTLAGGMAMAEKGDFSNWQDQARDSALSERAADWRNGAMVYQVIVDRFAPSADLEGKVDLYPAPKKLRQWDEVPRKGTYNEEVAVWSHEIDFWGGDFTSLMTKLDWVVDLGMDVLYLNPIHLAYTNHKYDAQNYFEISPEYGTREQLIELVKAVHGEKMYVMLDGVFNHMGRTSPWFKDAMANAESPWREWFYVGPQYKLGYRAWVNVDNLPEVNLESERVRGRLFNDPDSVIQGYLRDGVDGWRLDVAFDIGFRWLGELTGAAHSAKPGSLIIGEVWNYPEEWTPALDGVMNMTARQVILDLVKGNVAPALAGRHFDRMIQDAGIEPMLKSWIILDNHDTPRLRTSLGEQWQQRTAQVLQFTLPGSPCIYYGVELGMEGGDDPEMRAPMRWDLATDSNPHLQWMRQLVAMRKSSPALRYGDFRLLDSQKCLAFMRSTNSVRDLRVVLVNPTDEPVRELLLLRDSKVMNWAKLRDMLGSKEFEVMSATMSVELAPHSFHVLAPVIDDETIEYSPYKRVR